MTRETWRRKDLFSLGPHHCSSLKEVRTRTQKEQEAGDVSATKLWLLRRAGTDPSLYPQSTGEAETLYTRWCKTQHLQLWAIQIKHVLANESLIRGLKSVLHENRSRSVFLEVNTSENALADFADCFWASSLCKAWAGEKEAIGTGLPSRQQSSWSGWCWTHK